MEKREMLYEGKAKKVYAIDVGQEQLDKSLINNPKVINIENTNIKPYKSSRANARVTPLVS